VANPRFELEVGTLRGNHYVYVYTITLTKRTI